VINQDTGEVGCPSDGSRRTLPRRNRTHAAISNKPATNAAVPSSPALYGERPSRPQPRCGVAFLDDEERAQPWDVTTATQPEALDKIPGNVQADRKSQLASQAVLSPPGPPALAPCADEGPGGFSGAFERWCCRV
jgi:hypothetical protein